MSFAAYIKEGFAIFYLPASFTLHLPLRKHGLNLRQEAELFLRYGSKESLPNKNIL